MDTLEHPASLNPFQQFRQACAVLSETSRAVLPAWYQDALDLDLQFHIRVDGQSVRTFFYNRTTKVWSEGIPLTEDIMLNEELTVAFATQLLKQVKDLKGTSLGIVIHIADEFATAELKPELDNPGDLNDLKEKAFHSPAEILDDSSVPESQASWRVMPYPAEGSEVIGTTVTISTRLEEFICTLRTFGENKNFPVVVQSLSAPLVAIMGLSTIIQRDSEKPYVAILQYPWFTAMAFFNKHSDIRLIRTLQHRGMRRASNFRHALATTNASLEFVDPDLYVIPLAQEVDANIAEDLGKSFPESIVETVAFPVSESMPEHLPEPEISVSEMPENTEGLSHTFGVLTTEKWFLQDFLPAAKDKLELYPSRNEMRLLRFLKLARVAVFAIAILGIAWLAFSVFTVIRRPEWAFNENEAKAVQQRMVNLTQESQRLEYWNTMLEDRSKAWCSMEAVARLFPANSGLLLKNFGHTVRPDSAPGQATVGFVKEWTITGMARDQALAYLNSLNTREGISAHFAEISKVTGNSAYDPAPTTRTLVVNVKTQENSAFKQRPLEEIIDSDESTYPYSFNLVITQRFESADPLAINASKAP